MNKDWEIIQKKTFTNWINNKLKLRDVSPIVEIAADLSSGEKLILLLVFPFFLTLGNHWSREARTVQQESQAQNPEDRKLEHGSCICQETWRYHFNFLIFLVVITNIGAEDLESSNEKLILGLIWSIILRFTIADITMEGRTAKEGLLLWVQKRTTPYVQDFFVKDFTYSWMDGLAFCGITRVILMG
jgi:hypothetical protein